MITDVIKVLREAKITQTTGAFVRYGAKNKIEGKCALGVLACESGVKDLKLTIENQWVDKDEIVEAYGIEDILLPKLYINNVYNIEYDAWDFDDQQMTLSDVIVTLNDRYRFTFKQIADFLEATFDL